jgi:hypothetical protein
MKKQLSMKEFADHISLLYKNFASSFADDIAGDNKALPSYTLRPLKIIEHYSKKTLNKYIDLCKEDNRSQTFIQKLIKATEYTMTNTDFRNALKSDINSQQLSLTNQRKRIPRVQMFSLLQNKKPEDAVKLYESVFGYTKFIREDMKELSEKWNTTENVNNKECFDTLIIKYNNMRAYKKKNGIEGEKPDIPD